MRVGLLEDDEALAWQSGFMRCVDDRVRLGLPGLRYLTSWETLAAAARKLSGFRAKMVFLGSGDFHHLSLLFIRREAAKGPLSVLVFDRHLDVFPCAKGFVSCGSWLRELTRFSSVRRVLVFGVTEPVPPLPPRIIALSPLAWWHWFLRARHRLLSYLGARVCYISIDKDVFTETATNWGTGRLRLGQALSFLGWLMRHVRVTGVDVCGEFVPRGLWATFAERRVLAESEKINLLLCRFFARRDRERSREDGAVTKPSPVQVWAEPGGIPDAGTRAG